MLKKLGILLLGAGCAWAAQAKVDEVQAARLDQDLTPLGAERAGNADGSIPPWTGGITQAPAGYRPGMHHLDPFAADRPRLVVDSRNMAAYQALLTPGTQALLQANPDYHLRVFPTRRSASLPQRLYDATRANASRAELIADGNGVQGAAAGVPFPLPQSGQEAIWNHITRYRGGNLKRIIVQATPQTNGSFTPIRFEESVAFPQNMPDLDQSKAANILTFFKQQVTAPARLAGNVLLVHETLDQVKEPRQAWGYNAGQRRVRRAQNLAYDTPIAAADGLRTADDTDMFNGAPDRYDWKLLGKKEIYIPYNNYKVSSPEVKYEELLKPGHLDPQYTRYELHRVWVVEGTLKPGARHIYSKRTLYLDEDSWSAAVVDQYDGRGELWRVSMAYLKNFYDLPYTWSALDVFHDLQARRYHVQNLDNEEPGTIDFTQAIPDDSYFKPSALRRRGTR